MLLPCHPQWFDIKLSWASEQLSFECVRDGDDLEYWVLGRPLLKVVKAGVRAELYSVVEDLATADDQPYK